MLNVIPDENASITIVFSQQFTSIFFEVFKKSFKAFHVIFIDNYSIFAEFVRILGAEIVNPHAKRIDL